jgi:hypothetical protein
MPGLAVQLFILPTPYFVPFRPSQPYSKQDAPTCLPRGVYEAFAAEQRWHLSANSALQRLAPTLTRTLPRSCEERLTRSESGRVDCYRCLGLIPQPLTLLTSGLQYIQITMQCFRSCSGCLEQGRDWIGQICYPRILVLL